MSCVVTVGARRLIGAGQVEQVGLVQCRSYDVDLLSPQGAHRNRMHCAADPKSLPIASHFAETPRQVDCVRGLRPRYTRRLPRSTAPTEATGSAAGL